MLSHYCFIAVTNFVIGHFKSAAVLEKDAEAYVLSLRLVVRHRLCDNPIVRCLTTRRKDKTYASASNKVNVDCDLSIASP